MRDTLGERLEKVKKGRNVKSRLVAIILVLSLLVSLDVFWILRRPGLTLAGDADCGILEHTHDAACYADGACCELEEHVHKIDCYSDEKSDSETQLEWQDMFDDYPYTGDLRKDLLGIAKTQVGYKESNTNFVIGNDGVRRGYTRYGAWYGTPYGDWSSMFVSFCLNFARADVKEFPVNIGADSMASQWKKNGKYADINEYFPVSGDLVFFKNNTVGIVDAVYNATIYVIRGDVENSVRGELIPIGDTSVEGWGIVGEVLVEDDATESSKPSAPTPTPTPTPTLGALPAPVVDITDGGIPEAAAVAMYSLRFARSAVDMITYLNGNDGYYFFTLTDTENRELPKDANGNYIVYKETGYNLSLSISSPNGFLPGTYEYQLPGGLIVNGGTGIFQLKDGTIVGDWIVSDDGLITMVFNENIKNRTDVTITAKMGVHFTSAGDHIKFDGEVKVSVVEPPESLQNTVVTKWGMQGVEGNAQGKTNPDKIYWNVAIYGKDNSNIVGSVLSDRVLHEGWTGTHKYTQDDMEDGLRFGASAPDGQWYAWTVYPGDPNLIWTESGWEYKIPDTIWCDWAGYVTLGNDNWIYYVDYNSTPVTDNAAGIVSYKNSVGIDNSFAEGEAYFDHGSPPGIVNKTGNFISNAEGGFFVWEVQVTIPGMMPGQTAEYKWYMLDRMNLIGPDGNFVGYVENTANLSMVTASYKGTTIKVPRIQDATDNDLFAWHVSWSPESNGITYGQEIMLLSKCHCNETNCQFWNGQCGKYWYKADNGQGEIKDFCQCWAVDEDVTLTFVYETKDYDLIKDYAGLGYSVQNVVDLFYRPKGKEESVSVDNDYVNVSVPNLFEKKLTQYYDGYIAKYKITVNEAKLVLTDGSPLLIHDVMTNTLVYISGSLVITTEDENGNISELQYGKDYTVDYNGTGDIKENGQSVHVLDITILHPQPVKYILNYDATLDIPSNVTEAVKYSNSATVSLWGQKLKDDTGETLYSDFNISAKAYQVEIHKLSSEDGKYLPGAILGLYNEHGGLITSKTTDENGIVLFETNVVEGIILREHELYYIQEIAAPTGYRLDDTKHWFCFCSGTGDTCEDFTEDMAESGIVRIPFKEIGHIHILNDLLSYDLPETGGIGVYPLVSASVIFIVTPLGYMFIQRRKRGRRGDR